MKQKSMIVRNGMAILLAVMLVVCLSVGVTASFAYASDAQVAAEVTPAYTYVLGQQGTNTEDTFYFESRQMSDGWLEAMDMASKLSSNKAATNKLVDVRLESDWLANVNTGSFGSDKKAFSNGAIYVPSEANVRIDLNGHVINRQLSTIAESGSVMVLAGTVEIMDGDKSATHNGAYTYGDDEVVGGIITGGKSFRGGAIYSSGNVTLKGGTLYGNEAAEAGGAVYVYANSKTFTLNGGKIINNVSSSVQSGNEKTNGFGGAIATTPTDGNTNAFIEVKGGVIAYNSAVNGGAIYVQQATLNIQKGVLTNNTAKSNGGAICAVSGGKVTVQNTEIKANEAANGGGISVMSEAEVSVSGGSLTQNVAISGGANLISSRGGAMYMEGGNATLVGVTVSDNASYGSGGAFALQGSLPKLNIEKGAITGNNATVNGGVAHIINGEVTVKDVDTLKDNGANGFNISTNGKVTFDNVKATNNGTDVVLGATAGTRFSVKGKVEVAHVSLAKDKSITVVGELLDGSNIHVDSSATGTVIATDYSNNNSQNGFAVNPSKFFNVNGEKSVMLLGDGKVKICDEAVEWSVQYDNGEFTQVADYGVAFEYGEKTVTGVKFGDEVVSSDTFATVLRKDANVLGDVVAHKVQKTVGADELAFQVFVSPVSLESEAFTIAVQEQSALFSSFAIEPDVVITSANEDSFAKNTDYVLSYKNNVNAGTAEVTVKGCGNYAGEVVRTFTITRNENFKYEVKWEHLEYIDVHNKFDWVKYDSLNEIEFLYNGQNQSGDIRASLVLFNESGNDFANYEEHVYVDGFGEDDEFRSNGLKLVIVFKGTSNVTEFTNVDKEYGYSIVIEGESNAQFKQGVATTFDVEMRAAQLDITDSDFAYGSANGLWQLTFGENAVSLLNGADIKYFENGEIKDGNAELTDAYAYYRGANVLKLELNGSFAMTDKKLATLQSYLNGATISYSPNEVADAMYGAVKEVKTTAIITFGDNYTVAEGNGTIKLEKTWYVVTAVNDVVKTDSKEPSNWTYGDKNFVLTKFAYRPQYGNDVIYTFVDGLGATVDRFAVVFDENGMTFYYVNADGSIDKSSVFTRVNSLYDYLYSLPVGEYSLAVTVPMFASTNDFGVVYSETRKSVALSVAAASLTVESDESVSWNNGVKYAIPSRAVSYNGQQNNTPKISLVYNGITLVEGVDYLLTSSNVDVTLDADLTVEGIGNFEGKITLEGEFEIMRASNYWVDSPSLPSWKYGDYDTEVNAIIATPAYIDANGTSLYFKVTTDEQGKNACENLDSFTSGDEAAVESLKALNVGTYYLWAGVEGSKNYNELLPNRIKFQVLQNVNSWNESIRLQSWVEGKFNVNENLPTADPRWGEAVYEITDLNGKVYYNSATGLNNLAKAKVGNYKLTVKVIGNANYQEITDSLVFEIFEKPGLPWWAILLIVVGSLGIVAGVLYVLHEKGVLQMLTGKAIIAMRTKATIDATIAAVRANKLAEASKKSIAAAEERDRLEQEQAEKQAEQEQVEQE